MQSTINIFGIIGLIGLGAVLTLLGVMVGAYLAYRVFISRPGEGLLGGVPKGEVFTIPDDFDADPDNEVKKDELEENVLKRASQFLSAFGGKKNESSMP